MQTESRGIREILKNGFTRDVGGLIKRITLGILGKHSDSLREIEGYSVPKVVIHGFISVRSSPQR